MGTRLLYLAGATVLPVLIFLPITFIRGEPLVVWLPVAVAGLALAIGGFCWWRLLKGSIGARVLLEGGYLLGMFWVLVMVAVWIADVVYGETF